MTALFALAFATSLCHEHDPTQHMYNQEDMRSHLIECYESKTMKPFPILKKRRHGSGILKSQIIPIYCVCRMFAVANGMVPL